MFFVGTLGKSPKYQLRSWRYICWKSVFLTVTHVSIYKRVAAQQTELKEPDDGPVRSSAGTSSSLFSEGHIRTAVLTFVSSDNTVQRRSYLQLQTPGLDGGWSPPHS